MNRLLIILFGIVSTVSVSILLMLLYRYASHDETTPRVYNGILEEADTLLDKRDSGGNGWLEGLAVKKRPSHSYAVSEMEIELPLKKSPKPRKVFRLTLDNLDDYKMFCIRQLLTQNGIKYAIFRKEKSGVLMIHDLDKSKLERIVDMVREYEIKTKIENYTKD
ncbi:hypothetical protein [Hydrogenimonas cancrithermarum]|uniref:Periplasmic protein n=1 Tax=Hydrogenimonas cancrithermarum TaxID=2993563 RepID=A0ABM8FNA7_9BACT|nr:hypothetical protein [Hydrogenimonas cancrithermarum]BDY13849.1 hypothetical protein HCR_21610 [Hydrogenimonas cancrithermarum]